MGRARERERAIARQVSLSLLAETARREGGREGGRRRRAGGGLVCSVWHLTLHSGEFITGCLTFNLTRKALSIFAYRLSNVHKQAD